MWTKVAAVVALLLCGLAQFATAKWKPAVSADNSVSGTTPARATAAPAPAHARPAAKSSAETAKPLVAQEANPPAPPPAQDAPPQAPVIPARVTQAVSDAVLTRLAGNTHPLTRTLADAGPAPQDLPMQRMLLMLKRSPEQDAALSQFMEEQQDKTSPNFQKWLTPEQFGQLYGPADADVQAVTNWLGSHGFQVTNVTKGRTIIEFSGTAAQVQEAFHTEIHKYLVNGEEHWANSSDPEIPSALAPVIHGLASLNNFPRKSQLKKYGAFRRAKDTGEITPITSANAPVTGKGGANAGPTPDFTYTRTAGTFYGLGPADFAKIYNVQSLWDAGIDGTGQSIAIVGQTDVNINDINTFRSMFGLPANPPQIITNGIDPGFIPDETESDADLEWAGAVAKNATIKFVTSATTATTFGVDLSALYIIENNVAPVMSESYGECEFFLGTGGNQFYNLLWQQAAAEGITVMISSGDSGAAGCDQDINIIAYDGLAVNGLSSTPYTISVGGTDYDDLGTQSTYWNATNAAVTSASAKSYIPEVPWNNTCAQNGLTGCNAGPNPNGIDIVGGGGGPSNCLTSVIGAGNNFFCTGVGYPKPLWQTGTGVPADGVRDTPDISLFASNKFHGTGYVLCESDALASNSCDVNSPYLDFIVVGGTSLSSPAFAGMMALVNQKVSTVGNPTPRQGNANYVLYKMAAQANATCDSSLPGTITNTACIFYDVTKGNNSTACYPNFYPSSCSSTTANVPGVLVDPNHRTTEAWSSTTGYDMATGLGTVNAFNMVNAWSSVAFTASTTTLTLNGGTNALSIPHGTAVSVAGSVTPGAATGNISLVTSASSDSGIEAYSLTSGGAYSGTTHALPGGTYNVHAHYPGDGNVGASDSGNISVTVTKENSFVGLFVAPFNSNGQPQGLQAPSESVVYGTHYFLHATSTDSHSNYCNPTVTDFACGTGTMALTDNSVAIGTFPMNSFGVAEDQSVQFSGGVHNLQANYSGDNSYNPSFNFNTLTVTKAATTTGISTTSPATISSGTSATVTASIATQVGTNVGAVAPSGTVQFKVNGNNFGSAVNVTGGTNGSLLSATAALVTTTLPVGADTITAVYVGDTNYSTSTTAASVTITVTGTGPADMTVSSAHAGSFFQGQTGVSYTLTANNIGSGATTGTVTVVDTLPSGLTATAMSGTGWACTFATGTCTRSDVLSSGAYPPITLTVNVAANAPASVTNSVVVSGGGETNTANDSATDPTTVTAAASGPNLAISMGHNGNFTVGTNASYLISVNNVGNATNTGTITVTDTLPTGLTFVSGGGNFIILPQPPKDNRGNARAGVIPEQPAGSEHWTCSSAGQVATCTLISGNIPGGTPSFTFPITVSVAQAAVPGVTNVVVVADAGDVAPGNANKTASDPTIVSAPITPDLTITKIHTGNFTQGQVGATYTITVTNSGTGPTTGTVTMADTLPTGLTATSLVGSGWNCTLASVSCTRSDVLAAAGAYPAITLTVNVASSAPASVTNSAAVSGGGETTTSNDTATDPTTITGLPDMIVTSAHTGNFSQGQTGATYTLTAKNNGSGPTTGTVTVVDTLPTGLTATAMSGTGWNCTFATGTCTRSDVLAGATSYPAITLTVDVAANAPTSVTNSVAVSGGGETNTANDSATDPTTVTVVAPDLTIAKNHTGNFNLNQVGATYTITVSNGGNGPTTGTVTVVDTLPAGLTATAMAGTGWNCTFATGTCTRSDALAAAGSYPAITLTVNVAGNAAASVTNSVTVSGGGEITTTNDTATDPTTITQPDLTVAKIHTGNFTQSQVGATYTITVTNSGTGATTGAVNVVDTLPTGLTATAMTGTGWACTVATTGCTRSDALAGSTAYPAITLTVTVAANAATSITNNVAVSGGGEVNTANDSAADVTTVIQVTPDMTITKVHTGNFTLNQTGANYTITVTNSGNGPTSAPVTVVDTLPASLTATAISGTGWTCTLATLTCTRADQLAVSTAYPVITVTVTVSANAPASVTNTAVVSGGGETNTANDTANDATTITQPDMTITKTHTGNFNVGQVGATYTITATNSGNGPTSGTVTVVDTVPTGLTATAMAGTGWSCTVATATCTRSDVLNAGAAYPAITLTVTVANPAPASVTNNVAVSGGGELNLANDSASDITSVSAPDLTITKSHTGISPGNSFVQGQTGATYTITVTNSGAGPTAGTVTVADILPAGLTASAMAGAGWNCTVGTVSCTRSDVLAAAGAYPAITLTVNVAGNAAASVTNNVTVSGGGEVNAANDSASDVTGILTPPSATPSANTLTFTTAQGVGTASAPSAITIKNNGGAPLTLSSTAAIAFSGTNASDFTAGAGTTCTNGAVVAGGGGTCLINVVFTPAAAGTQGPATLTVTDNASPTTQTVALNGTGIDFTPAGPGSPVSVTAGATANFNITVTPGAGGFPNAVTFSASGLPAGTTATFNPTSVTPGNAAASTTLAISTTARGAVPPSGKPRPGAPQQLLLWSLAGVAMLLGLMLMRKPGRKLRPVAVLAAFLVVTVMGIAGCTNNNSGTPAGSTTITVTATSGSVVRTTTVTLTVQ